MQDDDCVHVQTMWSFMSGTPMPDGTIAIRTCLLCGETVECKYDSRVRLRYHVMQLRNAIWKTSLLVFVERYLLIPAVAFLSRSLEKIKRRNHADND